MAVQLAWTFQEVASADYPGRSYRRGIGAFAAVGFSAGSKVCRLSGEWVPRIPEPSDPIQACYILAIPGHRPPFLDQRGSRQPDVHIQVDTGGSEANVVLDCRRRGYFAARDIAAGEELLVCGTQPLVLAMVMHQASTLTPPGVHRTGLLEARPSTLPGAGFGLFSRANLPAGWLVGAYLGTRKPRGRGWQKGGAYEFLVKGKTGHVIDAEDVGRASILRYMNHGRPGNVIFEQIGSLGIVAFTTRSVSAGAELFADYGRWADAVLRSDVR